MNNIKYFFLIFGLCCSKLHAQPIIPVGHSHNDYLQKTPLYDALKWGYASIEIDICLDKNNVIKVAHNPWFLSKKRTIEEMYLEPIAKMIEQKDSLFKFSDFNPLTLIIDIKTNGDSTYYYLRRLLLKYTDMITQYNSFTEQVYPAPLKILLTGARPVQPILSEKVQVVKIDEGLVFFSDHTSFFDTIAKSKKGYEGDKDFIVGQVNLSYHSYLAYNGVGAPNEEDKNKLNQLTDRAHKEKKSVRLYAAGNNKKIWRFLLNAGVDWINVDNLKKFACFYKGYVKNDTN